MSRPIEILRRLGLWFVAVATCLISGEVVARLDDWIFQNAPFNANPDRERDLLMHDVDCLRGRPHGQFKKYKLNAFGFRGPEIAKQKSAGTTRVVVLGASETFGLYESIDHDYPALLRKALAKDNVEIINAAIAGMSLPTLAEYWERWVKEFEPDIVLIYSTPPFYLDIEPPTALSPEPETEANASPFQSRLWSRFEDCAKQSDLIKSVRVRFLLAQAMAGKDESWFYRTVPADRLDGFRRDLESLAAAVEKSGAKPILITHAFKALSPSSRPDAAELDAYRIFFPRAEPAVLPAFDEAARQATVTLGKVRGWPVIDAAAELSPKRSYFADPVHFNDAGSQAFAALLARELRPLLLPLLLRTKGAR
jgi:lysophospholipase L1-like esterase